MRIKGYTQFDNDLNLDDLTKLKFINLTFTNQSAFEIIGSLDLIPEIRYFENLFYKVLEDLQLSEYDNVALTSPSLNELIFNLSILSAIQNKNIEFVKENMYYTGQLRGNAHLQDEDSELESNLDD
jgi:hypothetical protein